MEGLIRIRAGACVSNPVGADVIRIEAPQISGGEDRAEACAQCVGIDRDTLRGAACAGERVRIVKVLLPVTKDRARGSRRTGLRNTALGESISLCGIGEIDASLNHDGKAARGSSRRRCWGRREGCSRRSRRSRCYRRGRCRRERGCGCWRWALSRRSRRSRAVAVGVGVNVAVAVGVAVGV